eukprot:CAMPEP_0184991324 /NCGR_PEP_ID=MMETSP1098-20130426/36227_1 /TAXON_ID=89044 /ORGANISM="Spumella elongata, Strain CCAP 955/1" /LENGTH=65 /DNA_ID=CAMNT_0027516731 /DNA_START=72 /DNA_END=266 /DNA_ORIENTATION=+
MNSTAGDAAVGSGCSSTIASNTDSDTIVDSAAGAAGAGVDTATTFSASVKSSQSSSMAFKSFSTK